MLKIGDRMPDFEVLDQDGNTVRSQDLIGNGRKTIIYFYPKDNTSGCTAEACSFRDNYAALTEAGYNVIGVSKDSVASHKKFEEKFNLPFILLSDEKLETIKAYFLDDTSAEFECPKCKKKYSVALSAVEVTQYTPFLDKEASSRYKANFRL